MKTPLKNPLQYAAAFTLDLYCDHENPNHSHMEFPHIFVGKTLADCVRQAKKEGWRLHKESRTATCPKCNRTSKRTKRN